MLWPVVKALLGHYRRYPLQVLLVWLGLTLGVSLLVGVTAINQHAQQSYTYGEKLFSNPLPYRIRPKHSANKIPQGFYIQMRRAGFTQCAPFDNYSVTLDSGTDITLLGVDPVAMIKLEPDSLQKDLSSLNLMKPPYPVLVSKDLASHMSWHSGDFLTLESGRKIGPIRIDHHGKITGTRIITDISLLRTLRKSAGLSVIACGNLTPDNLHELKAFLPNGIQITRSTKVELESLTKAFHLNLAAMGMLSFVVGLFIFYQAMSLSFTQRQPLVGTLRQLGVSTWQLGKALLLELLILILLSWVCGNIFGLLLANQLIPAVSTSLGELYDANVGMSIYWSWEWSSYSLLMATIGAFSACGWPVIRLLRAQPIRLTTRLSLLRFAGKEFFWQSLIGVFLALIAVSIYQLPQTQKSGFTVIALMLMSAAFITPYLIWTFFTGLSYSMRWVRVRWFFADAAASMSYRGVATMAFMLALTANVGVETLVGSFRDTTDQWLTQRLAADLYIYPSNNAAASMSNWLSEQPEVNSVWWRWERELTTPSGVVQVVSSGASEGERKALTVKLGIPNYWYHLHHSKGVMISESMAAKLKIKPGDYIDLEQPLESKWQVVGVYFDYGNPYHQVLMSHKSWLSTFGGTGNVALGVVLSPHIHNQPEKAKASRLNLKHRIEHVFRINSERIFDNSIIHSKAMRIFDRTFAIADTLGNITLVIAVFGIFFATIAGEVSRQRHMALLRCLGISSKELIVVGGMQLFVFGLISAIIALPLGLGLAYLSVDIIIKQSFGWSLELHTLPWGYAKTFVWTMSALICAGALPVLKMMRNTPIKSLRNAV